jgi:hypothetical protein
MQDRPLRFGQQLVDNLSATPAFAFELFRYRGAAKDGGTVDEAVEQIPTP